MRNNLQASNILPSKTTVGFKILSDIVSELYSVRIPPISVRQKVNVLSF